MAFNMPATVEKKAWNGAKKATVAGKKLWNNNVFHVNDLVKKYPGKATNNTNGSTAVWEVLSNP